MLLKLKIYCQEKFQELSLLTSCFAGFYNISTTVGYLMPNHVYTYTLNIYDLQAYFVDNKKENAFKQ